jgi:hypothetical protein
LSGTLTGTIATSATSVTISTPVYSKSDTLTLTATATAGETGLTAATSSGIVFSAGVATQLVFTTEPSLNTAMSTAFATQPVVTEEDANGNTVTTDNSTTVTLAIGTNPGGVTTVLGGTKTKQLSSGVANFSGLGLNINNAGTGYTLTATDGTPTGTSSAFNIITSFTAVETGNWETPATWGLTGTAVQGLNYPGPGDTVTIPLTYTVTATENDSAGSVTFASTSTTAALSVSSGVTLTVSGAITLENEAATAAAMIEGAGTISCASVAVGTSVYTVGGTTTLTSTISTLSISGNLTINGVNNGSSGDNADFALNSGSVTVGGTAVLIETGNGQNVADEKLDMTGGAGTLTLSGSTPITITTPGTGIGTFSPNGTGATVIYSGVAQPVFATAYYNLVLSGSGAASVTAGTSVSGNLSIASGASALVANSANISVETLTLGGVNEPSGTWGGTGSGAGNKNSTYFGTTTTGILTVAGTLTTTTTTLGTLTTPSTYGTVALSATVSPSLATGTVTFMDGATTLGTGTLSSGTATFTPTASQLTVAASPHSITAVYGGAGLYTGSTSSASTLNITAKALTALGTLSVPGSKVYDGTTTASVSGAAALKSLEAAGSGTGADGTPYNGDTVSLTGTASYAYNSKDVATASAVIESGLSLTGGSAGNYTLTAPSLSATITAKPLTAVGTLVFASSKVYDGTTTATPTSGSAALQTAENTGSGTTGDGKPYTGNGDAVSLTGTASYAYNSKDVATATTVTESGLSLTGTGSGDYTLIPPSFSATITAKPLTAQGTLTAPTKVYNALTTASPGGAAALQTAETAGSGTTSDGKPYTGNGDAVSLTGTASYNYNSKDVDTATTVTESGLSLTGAGSGDYSLTAPTLSGATITAKTLTVSGLTANSKTYNGTTSETLTGTAALTGSESPGAGTSSDGLWYTGDTVSLTGTAAGTFASRNAGTAVAVTVSGNTLGNNSLGDYVLAANEEAGLSANIIKLALTVTAVSASKTADGTTSSTAVPTFTPGLATGDTTTTFIETYNTPAAGTGKTLTPSGVVNDGNSGNNYSYTYDAVTTGTILPAAANAYVILAATTSVTPAVADQLTIEQVDQYGNIETSFTGTESLTFSGLTTAQNGTHPTITDKNAVATALGTAETISFTSGVSSAGGSLLAYYSETNKTLATTDGTHSTTTTGGAGVILTIANETPVAAAHSFSRQSSAGASLNLIISTNSLMAGATDANDDILYFAGLPSLTSGQGATLSSSGAFVFYEATNTSGNGDTFTYAISNGFGLTATATITITTTTAGGSAQTITVSGGTATINFAGIPGFQYEVQRSPDLSNWTTLETTTAPADGVFSYTDNSAPNGSAYYRLLQD